MNSISGAIPESPAKGRGAITRIAHRFAQDQREAWNDGWPGDDASGSEALSPLKTEVRWEDARSAINCNDSPDIPFTQSLNPYRGCEHGCSYCYARPTHSYLGLSPGLDFETVLIAKRNIASLLRQELTGPHYQASPIALGTATDAYQPVERQLRLTRSVIEVLHGARHPFSVVTKSSGVERDCDLLTDMARLNLVAVYVTITTLNSELARKLEPRAA